MNLHKWLVTRAEQSSKPGEPTRILVVDDHPLVRECLGDLLCREPGLTMCGEAEDRSQALALIPSTRPDLVIVDLSLKNSDGLELIKDIHSRWPSIKILVVSMHDESVYAERVLRAGAQGYVAKQEATRQIIQVVHRLLEGETYLNNRTATQILTRLTTGVNKSAEIPSDLLADRELQVFELTGHGLNTRQIAEQLRISVKTVETYRARIRGKLKLKAPGELLRLAIAWTHHP